MTKGPNKERHWAFGKWLGLVKRSKETCHKDILHQEERRRAAQAHSQVQEMHGVEDAEATRRGKLTSAGSAHEETC